MLLSKATYDIVVLAANWGGSALALADTNDVDGRAIRADEGVQWRNGKPEEVEDLCEGTSTVGLFDQFNLYTTTSIVWRTYRLDLLAALNGACVAVTSTSGGGSRGSHSDGLGGDSSTPGSGSGGSSNEHSEQKDDGEDGSVCAGKHRE